MVCMCLSSAWKSLVGDDESAFHEYLSHIVLFFAGMTVFMLVLPHLERFIPLPSLLKSLSAPYGRYSASKGWGPLLPAKVAWIIMESPSFVVSAYCLTIGKPSLADKILLSMYLIHYVNRAFIFPFRMSADSAPMPISVMGMAFSFCMVNGYLQGRYLTHIHTFDNSYLLSTTFRVGTFLWLCGFYINLQSDQILRNLRLQRSESSQRYFIPRGGMFDYVSGANYFGEIVEWIGFAVACNFSLPAVTFAVFTAANIGPRAYAHHQWYLKKFDNYPKSRKALIPFVL